MPRSLLGVGLVRRYQVGALLLQQGQRLGVVGERCGPARDVLVELRQLRDELPFSTTVEVERWEREAGVLKIGAVIWVERDGQKAIVVGAGGAQIKRIGTAARKEIERQFDEKVFLELWVKVREKWSDDEAALRRFGYE